MTPVTTTHIWLDDRGRPWIDDTNIKVIEVVLDKIAYGWSPEEIHEQHSHYLSLAQIHAAFVYYYDHKAEIDAEIERIDREYKEAWAKQGKDTPIHRKLRALGKIP
jgi:uncharacterized protein (DUF433 family)